MKTLRRPKAVMTACAMLTICVASGTETASARDSSLQDFFAEQFGLGTPRPQPVPTWTEENPYERPLVVRPRHRRPRIMASTGSAAVKGPVGPVSIYEDKTLRRGDAVMTAHGIRIFKGGATLPYRDSDFVAISEQNGLSRDITKTLIAMDHVSRN